MQIRCAVKIQNEIPIGMRVFLWICMTRNRTSVRLCLLCLDEIILTNHVKFTLLQ